jgi:hypothetical protein
VNWCRLGVGFRVNSSLIEVEQFVAQLREPQRLTGATFEEALHALPVTLSLEQLKRMPAELESLHVSNRGGYFLTGLSPSPFLT